MKRLQVVFAAAVAVLTASAIVTDTQLFEEDIAGYFRESVPDEDSSGLVDHGTAPAIAAPYPCSGFGSKYLSLDTGDATLWRTNVIEGDVYFDMAMKFTPTAAGDEPESTGKIVVYMDSDTNVVVISGTSASDQTPVTNTVPVVGLAANAWVRLTISAVQSNNSLLFDVLINGASLNSGVGYYSLEADTTVKEIGFRGSGAIDDFVARTTDPYYSGAYAARIGEGLDCERYANYSDALADALATTTTNASVAITLANDTTINGSSSVPYVIEDLACLLAFQKAMLDNPAVRSLCYVQTADIDMSSVDEFVGIGTTDTGGPAKGVPFAGTYDGQGHKIANVKLSWRKYAGVFNQVNGATIKNLIGENIGFAATGSGEHGCAMVGNGIATLENLLSRYTGGFSVTNTHNSGGIMVRAEGDSAFINCTNEADLVCCRDKMGGICCFIAPASNCTVTFTGCVNTGSYTLVTPPAESTYKPGSNGFAGILGYAQGAGDISMQNCENTGAFVNNLDTTQYNNVVRNAELLGFNHCSGTVNDLGGNKFNAANKAVHSKDTGTIGFKYATVDNNVATTTTTLAKDTTYLLLWDVAASETPVFTLQAAGDYIAFDTSGGYTFAGTVAVADPNMVDVSAATVGTVTTYTAVGGVAVASITKGGATTSYSTVAKALEAAESGDTVVLLAANADALPIPEGVTVDCGTFANTGTIGGSGTIKVNAAPASAPVFANDWTGTFQIFWQLAGATDITIYGNANSTIEIAVATSTATDGADRFYFATAGAASTISSTLKLSATVTQNEGWDNQTTSIAKLTGTGDFTLHTYSTGTAIPFSIGSVESYSGTLGGNRDGFTIGNIVQSGATFGDCLVKYGGTKGIDVSATTLNGETANLALDTLDGQRGVYLAAASVTTNGVTVGYASIDNALAAADAAYADSVTVYDTDGATNDKPNWSYENGVYTSTREIATVDGTPYTSLANAIAAAVAGDKSDVVLVAATSEAVTIPAGVTVSVTDDIVFSGRLSGAGAIRYTKAPASFVKADLLAVDWTGTYVADYAIDGNWNVNAYGTTDSVVEVADTWTGWYIAEQWGTTLKVTGRVEMSDGTTNTRITIPKVTGSGVFVFSSYKNYTIDQLEGWDGIMTNFYNSCFVTNIVSGAGTVVFTSQNPADGASIAVGSGFSGRLEYLQDRWDGTPYNIQVAEGSACTVALKFNKSNWTGSLAAYGSSTSAIEIGGSVAGYLSDGNGNGTGRIDSKVSVAGSLSINNCWPTSAIPSETWTSARCVQFANLTVDGSVTLAYGNDGGWNGAGYGLYSVARLDGDGAGAITVGNDFALKIDSVDFAELPSGTDAFVALTLAGEDVDEYHKQGRLYGPNGEVGENIPVTTNGVATGQYLVYDAGKGGLVLYVESPSVEVPVVSPGTNTVYDCGSAANAALVADEMNADKSTYIQAPAAAGLTGEDAEAYANLFTARADGSNVILELNDAGTNALETASTNVAAQIVAPANLALILSDSGSVSITGARPGFYYTVVYAANLATLDSAGTEGAASLASASGAMTLAVPARTANATSGFYRVKVYATEPSAPAGN
ncbi:MAG: hypothetical protein IKO72_11260 [Kiritimatiellae bacterium]|nr:hypothetical protein [Kiritimatiellia bacterium]